MFPRIFSVETGCNADGAVKRLDRTFVNFNESGNIIFHLYRALVINYHPKLKSTINIIARARVNNANAHYMTTPGLDEENKVIII